MGKWQDRKNLASPFMICKATPGVQLITQRRSLALACQKQRQEQQPELCEVQQVLALVKEGKFQINKVKWAGFLRAHVQNFIIVKRGSQAQLFIFSFLQD